VRSTVPDRYRDRTLDTFDGTVSPSAGEALRAARLVADGELRTLVLLGPPGVGKTHLAAAVVNDLRSRRGAAIEDSSGAERVVIPPESEWCNVPELIVDLRAEMGTPFNDAGSRARLLRTTRGLLVLDDLGREKVTEWTGELVYTLINARYEAMLPTIATSNLTTSELVANGYWPAISRLAEDGEIWEVQAPDQRIVRGRQPAAEAAP
jgi:DNA replication protein DnaC